MALVRLIANRLNRLLKRYNQEPESIFVEECRSLICEAKGDLEHAIKHRENEIKLIRQLHKLSQGTESEDFAINQYTYADLSERLDILAMLRHSIGDLEQAIKTLLESKQLCADNGVKFDGEDILQDYIQEYFKRSTLCSSMMTTTVTIPMGMYWQSMSGQFQPFIMVPLVMTNWQSAAGQIQPLAEFGSLIRR